MEENSTIHEAAKMVQIRRKMEKIKNIQAISYRNIVKSCNV